MKFRPALLLWGAVLIAMPVWADGIPCAGTAKESTSAESSVRATGGSDLAPRGPVSAGFLAKSTRAVALVDSIEANSAFDVQNLESFMALDTFFHSSSELDIHHARLSELDSYERASVISHAERAWREEGDIDEYKESRVPAMVPEPGSLSLMLLGLASVGFVARQRG
jgi:hypothetical protein